MFDCVMPTRNARNGQLFIRAGRINIANSVHRDADRPVEEGCPCATCRGYSRAYLAHLFRAKEILYSRLATMHNLQHYLDLVRGARAAILAGRAGGLPSAPALLADGPGRGISLTAGARPGAAEPALGGRGPIW